MIGQMLQEQLGIGHKIEVFVHMLIRYPPLSLPAAREKEFRL
jgi:hypothetical protein